MTFSKLQVSCGLYTGVSHNGFPYYRTSPPGHPLMKLSQLAIPTVSFLISFLSYGSQLLFHYIAPSPLTSSQSIKFNIFVACIWISYFRACFTDPGREPEDYTPPALSESVTKDRDHDDTYAAAAAADDNGDQGGRGKHKRGRWCRKCEAHKPPRAHHCKVCER